MAAPQQYIGKGGVPAPADLAISNLTCGAEMVSNEELFYSFEIHNLRGPAVGDFNWSLNLVDDTGAIVEELDSSTMSTYSTYGQLVLERASSTFIDATTASGTYSCHVMMNMDRAIDEIELINNEMMGENFSIQNEEELWANDVDRDGYNTTDTGDGIVDDCPDKYGESWGDRYGCADLDGDGWSNLNDFSPLDESQWIDEDEDGFGDNSSGYLGDQCPGVYGVENGEGGDGCPPPFVDADEDGVQDSDDDCDSTPANATVDENGCEVDTDGDGIVDSMDDCPATDTNATVDSMGCEVIEKHITLDNARQGPDHAASLMPQQFADFVSALRQMTIALGDGEKRPTLSESENLRPARRSIIARTEIKKGMKYLVILDIHSKN